MKSIKNQTVVLLVQKKQYLSELREAQDKFDETLLSLGEKIRTDVLIPVCKQYCLEFISGNGTFFFITKHGVDIYNTCLDDYYNYNKTKLINNLKKALTPIFEILNEEVSHGQYLAYYVCDVKKKDL